jgi:hypothetical protein
MLTQQMSARTIIHEYADGRLSARPEYYSGRGVNRGDLNGQHLLMVHTGVKREIGTEAAAAFVKMIEVIKDMSATGFLTSLYRLERASWQFSVGMFNQGGEGIAATDEITAFATFASVLYDKRSPEVHDWQANDIKREFFGLIGHEWKTKKSTRSSYGYSKTLYGDDIDDAHDVFVSPKPEPIQFATNLTQSTIPNFDRIPKGQTTVYYIHVFDSAFRAGPFRSRRRANRYLRSTADAKLGAKVVSGKNGSFGYENPPAWTRNYRRW